MFATYRKSFNSRCGSKWYFIAMPVMMLLFLGLTSLAFLPAFGLAACFATRLNDIGRSRWHLTWLMGWSILAKLVLVGSVISAQKGDPIPGAFAVVGWPLFIVAIVLGVWRGERSANRFGPAPLSWREYRNARSLKGARLTQFKAKGAELSQIAADMKVVQAEIVERMADYRATFARLTADEAKIKNDALDAARAKFTALSVQATALGAQVQPTLDAMRPTVERVSEVLAYRARV